MKNLSATTINYLLLMAKKERNTMYNEYEQELRVLLEKEGINHV